MIRADRLKSMVDSCAKIFGKTDNAVVGIRLEGGTVEVFAAAQVSAIRMLESLEEMPSEEFEIGVEADTIQRVLQGCGNTDIKLENDENHLVVRGVVNAKIPKLNQNPKIKIRVNKKYIVPAEWFRQCCSLTARFCAKEKTEHTLNCGHLEIQGNEITFCATDGRKGIYSTQNCEAPGGDLKAVNIPRESMQVMATALPPSNNLNAVLEVGDSGAKVQIGDVTYWCLQAEGNFPSGWREVFPKSNNLAPIDGKHLSRFSSVMDQLEVERAKFVSDGTSLKIYGKSQKVPEVDTKLDVSLDKCEMWLSPSLLSGAVLKSDMFEFGWGKRGNSDEMDAAVFVAQPFTAIALSMQG